MSRLTILCCIALIFTNLSVGQRGSIEDILEAQVDDQVEQGDILDFSGLIDLNSMEIERLVEIGLLSRQHVDALTQYRAQNGDLISPYELQSISAFQVSTIRNILPFVHTHTMRTSNKADPTNKHTVLIRWIRTLETRDGYERGIYRGDASAFAVRYQGKPIKRFTLGLTIEKDAGERGPDYISAHASIRFRTRFIDQLILGDFSLSAGLGLVFPQRFRIGKNAMTTRLPSGNAMLTSHNGFRESGFFRGIGISLQPHPYISFVAFGSIHRNTASIRVDSVYSSSFNTTTLRTFRSIQTSGYHRSQTEFNNKQALGIWQFGGAATYKLNRFSISFHMLAHRFQAALLDDQFADHSSYYRSVWNVGATYAIQLNQFTIFGEVAVDKNRRLSGVHGVSFVPLKGFEVSILTRHLHPKYLHLGNATFADNSKAENEIGLYLGTQILMNAHWRINAFADLWKHPYPRFGNSYPDHGTEYLFRLTYKVRKHIELYAQLRSKEKAIDLKTNQLVGSVRRQRSSLRLHAGYIVSKGVELRSRLEFSRVRTDGARPIHGTLFYQDLIFKPIGKRFKLSTRVAIFDAEEYLTRIYAFESGLFGTFGIPAYYGRGSRIYLNFNYRLTKGINVEARIARTHLNDRNVTGSGYQRIDGPTRTDLSLQLRASF